MSAAISTGPTSNNGVSDVFTITAPDGSKATVHSQGGHVTSWLGTSGDERLYMSPSAVYQRGKALRGGVPIIFPQFSDMGAGPTHGVARNRQWTRVDNNEEAGTGRFVFSIPKNDKEFPTASSLVELTVAVSDTALKLKCKVFSNNDTVDSDFSLLFHTYLAVSDVRNISVRGFGGKPFANGLRKRAMEVSGPEAFSNGIPSVVESIYYNCRDNNNNNNKNTSIRVVDNACGRTFTITGSETVPDVVLWNPGQQTISKFSDLPQPDGFKSFLCVEHGAIAPRAKFNAYGDGEPWVGEQIIRVEKHATKDSQAQKLISSKL